MPTRVTPLISSGGPGTRLWPLSRASKPKQFLRFGTEHSLIQETALRCRSDIFDPRPIVVGADAHRFLLAQDLADVGVAADILLEPVARSTCAAPAVLIEVQTGSYIGEDDIIRPEDVYNRPETEMEAAAAVT